MEDKRTVVLQWEGRPCIIHSQKKKRHPKFGWFTTMTIRYLDGLLPADGEVSQGKLAKAKAIRGPQGQVWLRVDQLVRQGMEAKRAQNQAMAELTKGVLVAGQPPE